MQAITYAQVQELVTHLPLTKLPIAYGVLLDLVAEKPKIVFPQIEFMLLPLQERQRLMSQQAAELVTYYEQTTEGRELWQGGDFSDH